MPTNKETPSLESRGFALGLWPEGTEAGIDEARLTPGLRRQVAIMTDAGWLDRIDGKLQLNEAGRRAIDELLPETPLSLTDAQHDVLLDVVEGKPAGASLSYAPVIKLLAYGYVTARAQRFGGLTLQPTERARTWYATLSDAPAPAP